MPRYVVERVAEALNTAGKPLLGTRVHLFGMVYKSDVDDVRESPAIDVTRLLQRRGAKVTFSDPHVPRVDDHGLTMDGVTPEAAMAAGYDCAVITTNHAAFDYARIVAASPLIVDTRNALKGRNEAHNFRL